VAGYVEHFGLKLHPFKTAPDPRFAFATRAHEIALLRIQDSVEQRLGLCLLEGDIGVGKSTVANILMQGWLSEPERYSPGYVANPAGNTVAQFARKVLISFGLEPTRNAEDCLAILRNLLLDNFDNGITTILLIDEAQTIHAANMRTVHHLTNEQTPTDKLLQIVLLAQPNIDRKLSYFPALRSRIARRGTLDPLVFPDAIAMMRHRITVAGGDFDLLFPERVRRLIYNAAGGVPRRLCVLADNAMMHSYLQSYAAVDEESVCKAADELKFETGGGK
jgi:general secretion pathway protein A